MGNKTFYWDGLTGRTVSGIHISTSSEVDLTSGNLFLLLDNSGQVMEVPVINNF